MRLTTEVDRGRCSNQERWIRAMSKVPWSLIGYDGYTEEDARRVCQCLRERAPLQPRTKQVLALENETKDLPDASV